MLTKKAILKLMSILFVFANLGTAQAQSPAKRPDLTVMTYNLQLLTFQDWNQTTRLENIQSTLSNYYTSNPTQAPDVIVFTEVFYNSAYTGLDSALSSIFPYKTPVVGFCNDSNWSATTGNCSNQAPEDGGVFIMSKWPIEVQKQHIYNATHTGTYDYWANKGFAYIKINKQGYRYHVIGTHMQADENNDPQTETHAVRMQQLDEIRSFTGTEMIPTDEPVIVAGDFNVEYSKQNNVTEMLSRLNATLSFPSTGNSGNCGSFSSLCNWQAKANAYSNSYSLDYNDTLDYVMALNGYLMPSKPANMTVRVQRAEQFMYWGYLKGTWPEFTYYDEGPEYARKVTGYEHNGYYRDLSDHFPVIATFSY